MQQLLYIETILKFSGGLVLLLLPLTACSVFGLPKPQSGLWPRLLGTVLIGIAGATYIEGATGTHGLGMAGCLVINMVAVASILTLLTFGAAGKSRRARGILALLALALLLLSFLELGQI